MSSKGFNTDTALKVTTALAMRWPACFQMLETRRRPLKVGIHHDIMAAGGFAEAELRFTLGWYTRNPRYRDGLVAGAERVGLDGQPAGAVSVEEAEDAQKKNAAYYKKARQRQGHTPKAHPLFPYKLKLSLQRKAQ
jgi:ProP effector